MYNWVQYNIKHRDAHMHINGLLYESNFQRGLDFGNLKNSLALYGSVSEIPNRISNYPDPKFQL